MLHYLPEPLAVQLLAQLQAEGRSFSSVTRHAFLGRQLDEQQQQRR